MYIQNSNFVYIDNNRYEQLVLIVQQRKGQKVNHISQNELCFFVIEHYVICC